MMARRMRTAILAGTLGLAVLVPSGTAFAQKDPPRDPNPPTYDGRYHDGCYRGYHDGRGGMHDGYYDDQGGWHDGYRDDQGGWHDGYRDGRGGMHDGYRDGRGGMHHGW